MGLPFSIHIRGAADPLAEQLAVQRVWSELRRADEIFSTYRPDSAICRINRGEPRPDRTAPQVSEVLAIAEQARQVTHGAFDIRYAGAMDPSGVVKGWAAARAASHLRRIGAEFYLNAGGDLLLQSADTGPAWRVGIEHPNDPSGLLAVLRVTQGAIATSGSAHRGQHIIDPRTGSAARGVLQATVYGPDLVWADVFATAIIASGSSSGWVPQPAHGVDSRRSTTAAMPEDTVGLPAGYEVLTVTVTGDVHATPGMLSMLTT